MVNNLTASKQLKLFCLVVEAKKKMESGESKLNDSRRLLEQVAMKSNAEFIDTLKVAHQEVISTQQAKASLEERTKEAGTQLRTLLHERKTNRAKFEKSFAEGKERIVKMDLEIRHHLQKSSTLSNKRTEVEGKIRETEADHDRLNATIGDRKAELEMMIKIVEEQEKQINGQASKIQVTIIMSLYIK